MELVVISLRHTAGPWRLIFGRFAELPHPWTWFDPQSSLVNPDLIHDEEHLRPDFGCLHSSPAGAQARLISKDGARRLVETCRPIVATVDPAMDCLMFDGV